MATHSGDQKLFTADAIYENSQRLRAAILFFLQELPGKLVRNTLGKHLYYADGHFFQKTGRQITEHSYLHVEGSPLPLYFNELIHAMVLHGDIEVIPRMQEQVLDGKKVMVLAGMSFQPLKPYASVFTREEEKVLKQTASLLGGDISIETRYFPNLYQIYTGTGLYETIPFMQFPEGKRPHLSWKAWAQKMFQLRWQ